MKWIRIADQEPDGRKACLIASDESDCVLMAMYVCGLWFTYDKLLEPVTEVSHWMYLPEPPPKETRFDNGEIITNLPER